MSSGPPDVPSGPPPEGYTGVAPNSTWDDWLLQRPDPAPPGGSGAITSGDFVSTLLRHGLWQSLDFANQGIRDGMRQLFDEYERDTAGQWTTMRDETQMRGSVVPWFQLKAEAADGQVSVAFQQTGDFTADYRLSAEQALALVQSLIHALEELAPDDPQ